jgi:hypothetical protein
MSARAFTILDAISDQRLFGAAFRDLSTWRAWRAFLAGLFGIAMSEAQAEVYRACTGRSGLPDRPFREAWLVCGRRSGKSFVMALIAVFLACFRDYRPFLAVGEKCTIMVVAADRKQARVVLRFVRGLLAAPVLAKRVVNDVSDAIELQGDVVIEVITASHAVRGYALGAALVDELAFFPSDDASVSGAEIIAAIRPAMATIPDSLLICASSPYARTGALWDAYRKHYGKDDAPVLVWRAPTLTMNPSVPRRVIDEAYEADPASAAAEYGAEFRTDVETFVTREAVEACVSLGVRERPPVLDEYYSAFVDPSGGSADAMTLAVGHRQDDVVVIDCLRDAIQRNALPLFATHSTFALIQDDKEIETMLAEHHSIYDFLLAGERQKAMAALDGSVANFAAGGLPV